MAKSPKQKRDPKAPRGPHETQPISQDELLKVADTLREMSGRLRLLAAAVDSSKVKVAKLKSWKTFAVAVKSAMAISGKFASDFESQQLEDVTGFGKDS